MILLKIIIGIYALLMIIASLQSLSKERNDQDKKLFHYINFTISAVLIVFLIFIPQNYLILFVSVLLIGYQILAIYRGLSTHSFHLQHHIIRFLITIVLIIALFFTQGQSLKSFNNQNPNNQEKKKAIKFPTSSSKKHHLHLKKIHLEQNYLLIGTIIKNNN
jgi:hypothetical protein